MESVANHNFSDEHVISITNEYELHKQVVSYIRRYYGDTIMISPSATDNASMKARSRAYNLGYMAGSVDLIVLHKNRKLKTIGMAIEFKSPTGNGAISKKQATFINQIAKQAFFIIIGNDYDDIIRQIIEYLR